MFELMQKKDYDFVKSLLPRLTLKQFHSLVNGKQGFIILKEKKTPIGVLTFTILWEKLPFIQHLIILESYRNQGYGKKAIQFFENHMKHEGYSMILLSTQSDEKAQFLYRKLGFIDCGCLVLENTPFDQPLEIFLKKRIDES